MELCVQLKTNSFGLADLKTSLVGSQNFVLRMLDNKKMFRLRLKSFLFTPTLCKGGESFKSMAYFNYIKNFNLA